MKKLFIISSILLAIVLIFLGIFNFAFKKEAPVVAVNSNSIQTGLPNDKNVNNNASSKINAMTKGPILSFTVDKKNNLILYYDAQDGTSWQMGLEGTSVQKLSTDKLNDLAGVIWSPDKSKVVTSFNRGGQISFYEYDNFAKKAINLKAGLDTVAWDNLGTKILYKYFDGKNRSLNIANPDGSNWQKLADITQRDIKISPIPSTSLVSFWNQPAADQITQLQTVGLTGGQSQVIFSGKYGADYLWSPDGSKAIVSSAATSNGKITLGILTLQGSYYDLNIPTIVSKCVWSQDNRTIYYALPGGIPDGAIMPNDYQDGKFYTEDTFWKVDINTGKQDRVIDPTEIGSKLDSKNLFLSPTEDSLYFINRIDQKLYKLDL